MDKDVYFTLLNINRKPIESGSEVEISYGPRTNKDLLLHYGFCLKDNCHDYYQFTVDMIAPPDANLMVIDTSLMKDGRTVV